jgi:FlaA1/EpsC-like NDP-sugar epimerase
VETKETFEINTIGTFNMLESIDEKTKFILASTCKAANPEVVYGASKLIAERMVLNHGGSVARFFNVIDTAGNVFEIWSKIPEDKPIDVAAICERHFISASEAVGLLIFSSISQPGRYAVNSSALIKINEVAERLFPNREKNIIAPRRGDRISEKFLASSESIEEYLLNNTVIKVKSIHDYL